MNTLVQEYRKRIPNDPRSDDQLTLLLGQSNSDGRFNGYKDFVDDYQKLTTPEPAERPPIGEEFRRAVSRGTTSLESSAVGLGALGADAIGADSVRDAALQKYRDLEQQSAEENAPSVSKIEDIHSAADAGRYLTSKAGELIPNVAEAGVFGLAGALAGTAAEPGAGTVAGGTAGVLEGFLGRQAAKSALRALVDKGEEVIADKATRELVASQLKSITKREVVSALAPETKALLETEGKALARKYGASAGEVLNFGGLGAGGQFPQAQAVNPDNAKVSALIAGIGGAASAVLPAGVIGKLFPGIGEDVAATYVKRLAANAAQHVPAGVLSMGAMELGNIAAERYADPEKRDLPLTDEELSRIMNAAVVGGLAGGVAAPVTAIKGPQKFDPAVEVHFANVSQERRDQIAQLKGKMDAGNPSQGDVAAARTLNPEEKAFYAVAEPQTPSTEVQPEAKAGETSLPEMAPTAEAVPVNPGAAPSPDIAAGAAPNKEPVAPTVPAVDELQQKRAAAAVSIKAQDPEVQQSVSKVASAAAQTNPTPTIAEKIAGNYQKGHLAGADIGLPGLTISIENPVGSERSGIGPDGTHWKVEMPTTYGQILGTKGRDGDPVDVHIGPNPTAETVYVVDQIDPKTGKFDEHKSFVGFESQAQAEHAYDATFSDGSGPSRRGAVTAMAKDQFKSWVQDSAQTKKPLAFKPVSIPSASNEAAKMDTGGVPKPKGILKTKVEEARLELADLLKEWEEEAKGMKEPDVKFKLSLDPRDFIGVKPKVVGIMAKVAMTSLELGAYKFADFASSMASLMGKSIVDHVAGIYEALREYLTPDPKTGKVGDKDRLAKLTPRRDMADAIYLLAEQVKREGKSGSAVYHPEHVVKPADVDVEGRGTVGKSGRSGGQNLKAKEAWNVERETNQKLRPWEELSPEEKDNFIQSKPELVKEGQVVEPAWFVPREKAYDKLAPRLLSDSSPPQKVGDAYARNSMSYRLAAIHDRETGQIHLVSVFENNREARVTKFTDQLGQGPQAARAKSLSLREVLEAKSESGGRRYDVVGSARTKDLHEYYREDFANRKAFREQFSNPLDERQKAVQSSGLKVAASMEAERQTVKKGATQDEEADKASDMVRETSGKEADETAPEAPVDAEGKAADVSTDEQVVAGTGRINLVPNEVTALRELPLDSEGKIGVDDLTDLITAKGPDGNPALSDALYSVIEKVAGSEPQFFDRVERVGLTKALKEYGYKIDAGTSRQVEPGAREPQANGVQNPERSVPERNGGPAPDLEGGQNLPGQTKQPELAQNPEGAQAGREVPGGTAGAVKHRKPDENNIQAEPASPEALPTGGPNSQTHVAVPGNNLSTSQTGSSDHEAALRSIHEAAARAGIDVSVIRERGSPFAGAYDPKNRTLIQVVTDTIGRQDVKTALHEVGHDVFSGETPEIQERLLRAVDSLSDHALGIDTSADTRIRSSDPANMGKAGVNEERLVESVAGRMVDEGFNPDQAKGFAQSFVRTLKDLYYRAALTVQKWLGHPENPELAQRYFENRVKSLLAGDTKGQSYVDFVGARRLARAEKWTQQFTNGRVLGERLSPDGKLQYDHVPDLDISGVKFNLPDPLPNVTYSRKTEVEQVAARLNHLIETVGDAAKAAMENPEVKAEAVRLKLTADAFARRVLRLSDPAKSKQWLDDQKESSGHKVDYDPNKKLTDFKDKANLDQNIRGAYGNTERLWDRAGRGIVSRNEELGKLAERTDRLTKALAKAEEELSAIKELKNDSSKDVANIDKTIGRYEFRRDSIRRRLNATERRVIRTNLEVSALDKMVPSFAAEKSRLGSKIRIGVESSWGHDMPYNVPEKPNATSEEVLAKDKTGKIKSVNTLKLDSSGLMTDPKEVEQAIEKQTEFLAHREGQARAGNENALDDVYWGIKHQRDEMLSNKDYSLRVGTAERLMFGLTLSPTGKRLSDGIGTPSARSVDRRLNRYETLMNTLHPAVEKYGRVSLQLENDLIRLTGNAFSHDTLRQDVLYPAIHTIEQATDLAERFGGDTVKRDRAIYQRVREKLLANPATKDRIGKNIDRFMPLLEKKIKHSYEASQYVHSAVREGAGVRQELGLGVRDKTLQAVNPATGSRQVASRAPLDVGPYTFSKRFSQRARIMSQALRASGWDGFTDAIQDPKKLLELTNHPEFGLQVRDDFVKELVSMPDKSPFFAPAEEGDVARVPANPELLQEAYDKSGFEQTGNLVDLAEAMFQAHDGQGDSGPYVKETLERFGKFYNDIISKLSEAEPDPNPSNPTIRGMMAPALTDARSIAHLPGSWLDYHSYDQRDMLNQLQRVASELAFGRGQEGLASDFETTAKEIQNSKARIGTALRELQMSNPRATDKESKAFLEKRFGKEGYTTLKRQADMDSRLTESIRGLSDYFRKGNSPDGTLRVLTRGAQSLGMMLVNQPASAIRNMEQLFAGFMKYGVSKETLGSTTHALKEFATEAVNSLTQAIGVNLQMESERHNRYVDLGHQDPAIVKKWHDAFDPQQGEGKTNRFFRGLNDIMGQGVNRLGPEATHTVFRPLQPFTWTAIMQDEALNHLTWDLAEKFVRKGMDFYERNREKLSTPGFKLTPDTLGLKGASKDTFARFHHDMGRWDLNFDDMVRGAMKRGDKTLLTNEEAQRLYGMSVSELSSESNIATMPLGAFNNSVLRVISPLLGWPYRRMMDVLSVGRNPQGKHDLRTLARGLAGISVMALGGLGVSALVNQYQEDVVGKKSNLRPLLDAPDGKELAIGIFENLSRAGTLGLLGEGVNGLVNVGLGGDNRTIFSLDQRVVALSSMSGIQQAISSWIHQGEADYAHVIRPVMSSMGGSGALQYMDIANNVLGLDNPESRVVARINAQNYLRVVGRQLGLEVRATAAGPGGYSPTPMSPGLTRMELAAYANDAADFQEAYYETVQKAKEQGFEDPVAHVKQAFAARNPLRTVFSTSPTQGEYNRILGTLSDGGRRDVEEAVNQFNAFAERIGARPFEGKAEKKEPVQKMTMPSFGTGNRPLSSSRAVSALFSR